MRNCELDTIKNFYGDTLLGYKEVGKGRLRRVIVYSKTSGHNKVVYNKSEWRYPDRVEWRNIFMILSGTIGVIKC